MSHHHTYYVTSSYILPNLVHGLEIVPEKRKALFYAVAARDAEGFACRYGERVKAAEETERKAVDCLNDVDGRVTVCVCVCVCACICVCVCVRARKSLSLSRSIHIHTHTHARARTHTHSGMPR